MQLLNRHGVTAENSGVKQVVLLIVISTVARLFLACLLELGNDEVYYWTYALYPDFSHFDHPPMVGFLIQASTLNLILTDDFFIRLGPIVLAACSTWLMFRIGMQVKNERTGVIAATLFTSSIYCSVIAGFAIVPDAPQIFFWLLCLYMMLDFLPATHIEAMHRKKFIAFGALAGLAMLSKYHSVFLWVGVLSYIVLFNRTWIKDYSLYISLAISLVLTLPILYWNLQHDFISFTFHGNRVTTQFEIRPDYFVKELTGEVAYNNPINYALIVIALLALVKKKMAMSNAIWILLLSSLPLYFTFTGFSLFRSTLPHWTGPSFLSLIIIAAIYWSDTSKFVQRRILFSCYFLLVVICIGVYVINYAPISFSSSDDVTHYGDGDFTQDMYGWKTIGSEFKKIALREELSGSMPRNADLVSFRWYPGAHEDFYIARPMNRKLYLVGDLEDTHKYCWINQSRGGLTPGRDYYHIAVSNYYQDPKVLFGKLFHNVEPLDTIRILRSGVVTRNVFIYKLRNYRGSL